MLLLLCRGAALLCKFPEVVNMLVVVGILHTFIGNTVLFPAVKE